MLIQIMVWRLPLEKHLFDGREARSNPFRVSIFVVLYTPGFVGSTNPGFWDLTPSAYFYRNAVTFQTPGRESTNYANPERVRL